MFDSLLKLITTFDRRVPAPTLAPELTRAFRDLRAAPDATAASRLEEIIWRRWMEHPSDEATTLLARATRAIGSSQHADAERLLDRIVTGYPDFAEAWNKRATLRFLVDRDSDSLADIERTLALEPRHFGAICGFGQICLKRDRRDAALFAFDVALRINPHLGAIRSAYDEILGQSRSTAH